MKQLFVPILGGLVACVALSSCTDNSTAQKLQKLEEQNKLVLAQNAELRQQMQKAEKAEEAARRASQDQTNDQCNALIDQILIKLGRVKDESEAIILSGDRKEIDVEVSRRKNIALDQQSQARSLVSELKAKKFPNAERLDSLVKDYINNCTSYSSYMWGYHSDREADIKRALECQSYNEKCLKMIKDL